MSPEQTVEAEARARRWAVPAAVAGALLPLVGFLAPRFVFGSDNPQNRLAQLFAYDDHATPLVASAVIGGIGYLLVAVALFHLLGAVRARRPEFPAPLGWMALAGAVLTAVVTAVSTIATAQAAADLISSPDPTYQRSSDLLGSGALQAVQAIGLLAGFLFGAGLVALSLNAMRVGLLPRFLGYVGIFAGIFTALPVVPAPVLLCFWLGAVAYLFSGRWPNALPPAWRTGRAEPWPSRQQARERTAAGAAGAAAVATPEPVPAAAPPPPGNPGAARRKRKKRR